MKWKIWQTTLPLSVIMMIVILLGVYVMSPFSPVNPTITVLASKSVSNYENFEIMEVYLGSYANPLAHWTETADDWDDTKYIPIDSDMTSCGIWLKVDTDSEVCSDAINDTRVSLTIIAPDESTITFGWNDTAFDYDWDGTTCSGYSSNYYGSHLALVQHDVANQPEEPYFTFDQDGVYEIEVVFYVYTT